MTLRRVGDDYLDALQLADFDQTSQEFRSEPLPLEIVTNHNGILSLVPADPLQAADANDLALTALRIGPLSH